MISRRTISQTVEKRLKMYQKNLKEEKRKYSEILSRRRNTSNNKLNSNNICILIALAFISSRQATYCRSLEEDAAARQWHEKYGQSNDIRSTDKWIPLKDFKSPLVHSFETMKTSETLMQPMNILSSLSRTQRNQEQQAIQLHHQAQQQPQQQFLNQLALPSTAASQHDLESSKVDLGILMASCSQLPGEEAQRQCQESYHQLRDLDSQSAHHHHLSLNIQGGFKPSKEFLMPQQQQSFTQQQQHVAQQHLDTSASILNTMKAPNLYHKRSSSFVPSDAIDSVESNSGHSNNLYSQHRRHHNNRDNSGAESVGSNYANGDEDELPETAQVATRNSNNYHHNRFRTLNNNANRDGQYSPAADRYDPSSAASYAASNSHDAASSPLSPAPRARRLPFMRQNQLNDQSSSTVRQESNNESNNDDADPGAAERSEQEAAEASEAEAADRAALDEQQQAQQEIIKAQAASEAKAIKEQQEALMMQQRLHQQIVLRRQHDLANNQSGDRNRGARIGEGNQMENPYMHNNKNSNIGGDLSENKQSNYRERQYNDEDVVDRGEESRPNQLQQAISKSSATNSKRQQQLGSSFRGDSSARNNLDIQFSDQIDNNEANHDEQDEVGDYSTRRASISQPINTETPPEYKSTIVGQQVAKVLEKSNQSNRSDLLPAEQHQYGSHYDSLKGHQSKYYQFAESKKKGQFDSGFKRGNKKFQSTILLDSMMSTSPPLEGIKVVANLCGDDEANLYTWRRRGVAHQRPQLDVDENESSSELITICILTKTQAREEEKDGITLLVISLAG